MTSFETIVVGAGQAGLAAGYFLQRGGVHFTILDSGLAVGDSWRNRWDSLRLFTPARYNSLPGLPFPGAAHALPGKDDVADYLADYARRFGLPIRFGTRVEALHREADRFVLATGDGARLAARSVIVATGANQKPYVPGFAARLDPRIVQVHSAGYHDPRQLPEGKVLVVGAGNSGVQIALELAHSGRKVLLSGLHTGSLPRRVLGRDIYDWLWPTIMRPSIDSALGRRLMRKRLFSGDPVIGTPTRALERAGIVRVARIASSSQCRPQVADGSLVGDIAAVVWCTGFRPDYDWIELPVLGLDGYPEHRRGMALREPGLAFVGMRFQYRLGSSLLGGVGEDARHVVDGIRAHLRREGRARGAGTEAHGRIAPWTSSSSRSSTG